MMTIPHSNSQCKGEPCPPPCPLVQRGVSISGGSPSRGEAHLSRVEGVAVGVGFRHSRAPASTLTTLPLPVCRTERADFQRTAPTCGWKQHEAGRQGPGRGLRCFASARHRGGGREARLRQPHARRLAVQRKLTVDRRHAIPRAAPPREAGYIVGRWGVPVQHPFPVKRCRCSRQAHSRL